MSMLATGRSLGRPPLLVAAAGGFVLVALVCAVAGTALAPHDPTVDNLRAALQGPSGDHWLGTDDVGRDVFSRVLAGAQLAVLGPVLVVVISAVIGTTLGLVAGYFGGAVDMLVMRITDLLSALPALLVAVVLSGALGGGYLVAVLVTCLLTVAIDVRVVRGAALDIRSKAYVSAAVTLGLSHRRTMVHHMLPNIVGLVVANAFLNLAQVIVVLSALSFLGLGIPPGAADWGRMLAENLGLLQSQPWACIAPGLALVAFAVSMNLVGDWLFQAIAGRRRT